MTDIKRDKQIVELYKQGILQREVAKKYNLSQPGVSLILNKNNVKKNKKIGSRNPNWKGGIRYDRGRKLIYSPNHPNPDSMKCCYEYRLIMEKHLGRYLEMDEVVHHINGDVTDNKIENLEVMKQSEHARIHCKESPRINFLNVYKKIKRNEMGQFVKYG